MSDLIAGLPGGGLDIRDDDWPVKAQVETDWFCEHCGYNLIGQRVRLHPELGMLTVRCPECASFFHPTRQTNVHSVWLRRLSALTGIAYILFTIIVVFSLAAACFGLSYGTLEGQTQYNWDDYQRQLQTFSRAQTQGAFPPFQPKLVRIVRDDFPQRSFFRIAMYCATFLLSFFTIAFLTVFQHHWRRWHYVCFAATLALGVPLIVRAIWAQEAPDLLAWAMPFIAAHAATLFAGGLLAALYGRLVARGLIKAVLPPSWRPLFTALWLADGLPPPSPVAA